MTRKSELESYRPNKPQRKIVPTPALKKYHQEQSLQMTQIDNFDDEARLAKRHLTKEMWQLVRIAVQRMADELVSISKNQQALKTQLPVQLSRSVSKTTTINDNNHRTDLSILLEEPKVDQQIQPVTLTCGGGDHIMDTLPKTISTTTTTTAVEQKVPTITLNDRKSSLSMLSKDPEVLRKKKNLNNNNNKNKNQSKLRINKNLFVTKQRQLKKKKDLKAKSKKNNNSLKPALNIIGKSTTILDNKQSRNIKPAIKK
ncbi:unnamed protein product [Didymodactylos carnosus]|uniref:Uncharacterized protein n=1 Tax=Didymodactylos carnosus TaxID=1234261 RepID=A0A814P836_9BILA|nr:unnamed protein product [Didymodactylos carnosus]CAF1555643.1 unnamed protein product [Didymodactylos carnosus]CAF3865271.1 unnamed protein product [Didymodactylos carnosus]CAF4346440.1 unnamed protein product [Didymodactylos carnosus]